MSVAKKAPQDFKIHFTVHALTRFKQRFPKFAKKGCKRGALELLMKSEERGAISQESWTRRAEKNNFAKVHYFRVGDCRFVACQKRKLLIVITIERIYIE